MTSWKTAVSFEHIVQARQKISQHATPTPLTKSLYLSQKHRKPIYLKLENLNLSGSFKIRGALNALLSADPVKLTRGVVAASAGNHAQGIAYVAKLLNIPATIFMPERTPLVKIESTKSLGATVVLKGSLYDDAFREATHFQKENDAVLVHAFNDPHVIAGQGTTGLEILEQCPSVSQIVIPVGGGGLASGIAVAAKHLNPKIRIIGVQAESFPSMKTSLKNNAVTEVKPSLTIADGIAVKRPGQLTFAILQDMIDELVTVSDERIAGSVMELMEKNHMLAEGAGAAAVAALGLAEVDKGDTVAIISGGNIDITLLGRITTQGLIHSGRMMRISVKAEDRPGKLAEILNVIGSTGANLLEVRHQRSFGALYFSDVAIELDLETFNFEHQRTVQLALEKSGVQIMGTDTSVL